MIIKETLTLVAYIRHNGSHKFYIFIYRYRIIKEKNINFVNVSNIMLML